MKHVGIIAEYNPYHKGHSYQISQIHEMFPDKKIISIMSGDYVQRGEPAIFSKRLRTHMALSAGPDIIIELPCLYATASSEHFATAGLLALSESGVIDTLCFGAECDEINILEDIAEILLNEPDLYKAQLKEYLAKGFSFPAARCHAIDSCFPNSSYSSVIRQPNNILAIEYIKAIKRYNLPIKPYIIKRIGAGYHESDIDLPFCSATALRTSAYNNTNRNNNHKAIPAIYEAWKTNIPDKAYNILISYKYNKPVFFDDLYPFLQYKLMQNDRNLSDYYEMSEHLANTINSFDCFPAEFEAFINELSGKHTTKARVRRSLLNALLNRTTAETTSYMNRHYIPYLRILGFRKESSYLIKAMQENTTIPLINKVSHAKNILSQDAYSLFLNDIYASNLYRQAYQNRYGEVPPSEYAQSVIIME